MEGTEKEEWIMITRFSFSHCEIMDRGYLWRSGRWIEVKVFLGLNKLELFSKQVD